MTTIFVPNIVLIDNPVVDFQKEEELLNFPSGTTIGLGNEISVIRTDFSVYNYRQNRTLQDIIQDSQALLIIQRYGLTVETANINLMPGLSSKERRVVLDYLARVRK
jgi:hypothetical protein